MHGRVSVCSGRDFHALIITEGIAWDSLAACWAAEVVVYNVIQKVRGCARKGRVGCLRSTSLWGLSRCVLSVAGMVGAGLYYV